MLNQPTPPKKPPRRNLSVSPTHLDSYQNMMSTSMDSGSELSKTPRTGAYEYLFLARSGAKSHSDLDEFPGALTELGTPANGLLERSSDSET